MSGAVQNSCSSKANKTSNQADKAAIEMKNLEHFK